MPIRIRWEVTNSQQASLRFDLFKGKDQLYPWMGDNVDDWNSHNSKQPRTSQLETSSNYQAYTMLSRFWRWQSSICDQRACYQTPRQHVGGFLLSAWFDHQRGYHQVEQFWDGIAWIIPSVNTLMNCSAANCNPLVERTLLLTSLWLSHCYDSAWSWRPILQFRTVISIAVMQTRMRLTFCGVEVGNHVEVKNTTTGIPFKPAVFNNAYTDFDWSKDKRRDRLVWRLALLPKDWFGGRSGLSVQLNTGKTPCTYSTTLVGWKRPIVAGGSPVNNDNSRQKWPMRRQRRRWTRSGIAFTVTGWPAVLSHHRTSVGRIRRFRIDFQCFIPFQQWV